MNYDVFISSKSEDYTYARQVYDFLTAQGYLVFLADTELRKKGVAEYGEVIDDALDSSEHMILFSSSADYVRSSYVKNEWRTFLEEKRSGRKDGNIVTILKDVEVKSLPISLRHFQSFGFDDYQHVVDFLPQSSDKVSPEITVAPKKIVVPAASSAQQTKQSVWQAEWDNWNQNRNKTVKRNADGVYAIGDLYDDGVKRGVVIEVTPDGKHGKIVSIEKSNQKWAYGTLFNLLAISAVPMPCQQLVNVNSDDGIENMRLIQQQLAWRQNFPAFAWCAAFGEGWYIPSVEEYRKILSDPNNLALVNATLRELGASCVFNENWWYWTSNENDARTAKYVYIDESMQFNVSDISKRTPVNVRAIANFDRL